MSATNASHLRYAAFPTVNPTGRNWPDRTITSPPRWLSTDLRDGNQALAEPMCPTRKRAMFDLLIRMGYKEIEVGFPSSSQADFDFIRMLIESDLIPDDVTIGVLTPAREDLIEPTVRSVVGARRAVLHVYNATPPLFRDVVYGIDKQECLGLAVRGAQLVVKYAEQYLRGTRYGLAYSPEVFVETELDFALEVLESVSDVWQPGPDREIILNLPATVERATPNVFADQVEWIHQRLTRREYTCLSVHPHNDRGTAVAAAELAVMAGADRIEGCLFGNGERTGNVCLVTLGMNLYTQGVDPGVDFSRLDEIRRTVEYCNRIPVHPRHPYGGDLVCTAFSGTHQDAIDKGLAERARAAGAAGRSVREQPWRVPYLPFDPADVGRDYTAIVRVNSQSGKGGVGYLMSTAHELRLPRGLRAEFAALVQRQAETTGCEVSPGELWRLFAAEYLPGSDWLQPDRADAGTWVAGRLRLGVRLDGRRLALTGHGTSVTAALLDALAPYTGPAALLRSTSHRHRRAGADGTACFVECGLAGEVRWGVGLDPDPVNAALAATAGALSRLRDAGCLRLAGAGTAARPHGTVRSGPRRDDQ